VALTPDAPPAVTALTCTGCGAALALRAPGRSLVIACGACGAQLDAQDPTYKIIERYEAKQTATPRIPLGTRGTLKGEPWEVIGYLVRRTTISGETYTWFEHLLHSPAGGFRWLVEYGGHWTLTKKASSIPSRPSGFQVEYLGERYHHFQTATAEIAHVVGELPWRARVGDKAAVEDFVKPPLILSHETSQDESSWSIGEYVESDAVWKAFALPGAPPERVGVGAAQPSPYAPRSKTMLFLLGGFVGAALLVHLLFLLLAQQRVVLDAAWEYHPGQPATASVETEPFTLSGRASNLMVEISSTLSQSWAYFTLTLVDEASGAARTFGREVQYYFGRDSDGAWTEGAPWDRAWLPSVPAGRYVLLVEPESPRPVAYRVRLTRDVPRPLWLWLAVGVLVVPPLIFWWRQWRFEQRRWEESDHPMTRSGGSSDDDE
jgi:Domain of unknown function (DUF4178)